ncbi:uncharacterized protein ACA1_277230 [Acanthamoeba castellanii str. Neff]|uniref:Uncharacterized protein n=1 Tax=Acanthamoeba castellanii (strain ATCC 30010 / Neff) TaxID=1257118 RepID=L8H6N3_ACACF|nr:uncharacterized protein ACA1_277230 [Acanthamoeba castellanii str. Neff]ELR20815.1 hypothetical protein ACA1_277230 [Acanthamoeba castellanii str. Neff]
MGINQSIPPHRIEPPRFRIGPPGKPMPRGNQYCSMRPLFWRLANSNVLVRLETDVALCFGDVSSTVCPWVMTMAIATTLVMMKMRKMMNRRPAVGTTRHR